MRRVDERARWNKAERSGEDDASSVVPDRARDSETRFSTHCEAPVREVSTPFQRRSPIRARRS